jgi:hypothetical protein
MIGTIGDRIALNVDAETVKSLGPAVTHDVTTWARMSRAMAFLNALVVALVALRAIDWRCEPSMETTSATVSTAAEDGPPPARRWTGEHYMMERAGTQQTRKNLMLHLSNVSHE